MNKIIMLFYFFSLSLGLSAQGESDWWYFGYYGAGIHFIGDTVEAVYDSAADIIYHGTTQSDENGNLLFYSNGNIVYSSNHEIMENGEDINNGTGISAISCKIGENDSIYHLVYIDYYSELVYKTININANNGLGIVSDPIVLLDSIAYTITATKQSNGIDYWVVCIIAFR